MAYGIGGLTPAEFGDLTPVEFVPYINTRIKWHEEQENMENQRFGLIAAILQSGIPVYFPKKFTSHKPGEYFKRGKPATVENPQNKQAILERSWAALMGWCNRGKS